MPLVWSLDWLVERPWDSPQDSTGRAALGVLAGAEAKPCSSRCYGQSRSVADMAPVQHVHGSVVASGIPASRVSWGSGPISRVSGQG